MIPADFQWSNYLILNLDVAKVNCNESFAKHHWITSGINEGRKYHSPDINFNWKFYTSFYKDLQQFTTEESALNHYINYGLYEGRFMNQNIPLYYPNNSMIRISPSEPRRINIITPGIGTSGGFLSILHFADELIHNKIDVRLLILGKGGIRQEDMAKHLLSLDMKYAANYIKIEDITVDRRDNPFYCHPNDIFMATAYQTVRMAQELQLSLHNKGGRKSKIIYFIQDYEPAFSNKYSQEYSNATYSYTVPHYAMFSTSILHNFFQRKQVGVFSQVDWRTHDDITIHSPAVMTHYRKTNHSNKSHKRLIVYWRPSYIKNVHQLILQVLKEITSRGHYNPNEWKILGIGDGTGYHQPLNNGQILEVIGALPQLAYQDFIETGDVGLSLTATAHPSLPSLEMAAAGLITVTNEWKHKKKEDFVALSPLFEIATLNCDSIVECLIRAETRAHDYNTRASNILDWPNNWSDERCYGISTAKRISAWLQ